jgi:two-component system response regulator (stage 0 sporulation protein F)
MAARKVLVVDDQMGIRILLGEVLQSAGYDTLDAPNGATAIELVGQEQPDVILLDMKMPGMDGLQTLKAIRGSESTAKIIMMTAYGELDLIQEAMAYGANSFLTKPFDIEAIREAIES